MEIGDKVYILPVGNMDRYNKNKSIEDKIIETYIIKVGRKYIYLKGFNGYKFGVSYHNIYTDISNYSANYEMYFSKEELINKLKKDKLVSKLQLYHNWSKYSLKDLETINKIIEGNEG